MDFRVQLETFRGPLDLLLFLVRKHEVDIRDIPIALITEQYLAHLEVLQQLDVNEVGDFLELASTLVEIKSQLVLPRGGEEVEAWDDPARRARPAAAGVQKVQGRRQHARRAEPRLAAALWPRLASDLPPREVDPAGPADSRSGAVGPGQRDGPHPPRVTGRSAAGDRL